MRNFILFLGTLAAAALLPAQPITTCNTTITSPGNYYFTGNLTCTAPANGITVHADNVTIDLKGFTLRGSGLYGGITNRVGLDCSIVPKYLRVTNGRITNWLSGIELCAPVNLPAQLSRASLSGLTIDNNRQGVAFNNIIGATLYGSTLQHQKGTNSYSAVFVHKGAMNSISTNRVQNNAGRGIVLVDGSEHNVQGNLVQSNASVGIQTEGTTLGTIRSNQVYGHPVWDMSEFWANCGSNTWSNNLFGTRNVSCIH